MIDPSTESLLSFAEAAGLLPRRRKGRKPHISTVYRWSTAGCRGVVLESIQIGGTRCTSREALSRFFARLTAQAGIAPEARATTRTPAQRHRAVEQANRELARAGI